MTAASRRSPPPTRATCRRCGLQARPTHTHPGRHPAPDIAAQRLPDRRRQRAHPPLKGGHYQGRYERRTRLVGEPASTPAQTLLTCVRRRMAVLMCAVAHIKPRPSFLTANGGWDDDAREFAGSAASRTWVGGIGGCVCACVCVCVCVRARIDGMASEERGLMAHRSRSRQ